MEGGKKFIILRKKGGVGIGSFKAFNYALLLNWRWRLHNNSNSIWAKVITAIHGLNDGLDHMKKKPNGLSVWISLSKLFHYLHERNIVSFLCLRKCIGNGEGTRFLVENWLGDGILMEKFPRLFVMESNKECLVSDKLVNGEWEWTLCKDGAFLANVNRRHIDVNIMIWKVLLDRLPTRENLVERNIDISSLLFPSCDSQVEDSNHVFVHCEVAEEVWRRVFKWLDLPFPLFNSVADLFFRVDSFTSSHEKKKSLEVIMLTSIWMIWMFRNSVVFQNTKTKRSSIFDVLFYVLTIGFLIEVAILV
uniref:Reverse transcriptase zinc-binding domain-containing protein n=1 Tax=Lactuca sativa TaxID=4236 RepID=A0A9R1UT42_LACSA|nr:hypothetical protein LSAT_V11C800404310 [Lactuca sativa]